MSVEKLDFNYVRQSQKSFTTFLNDVIQNLHDLSVLGVYCYLSSLPQDWNINRKQLMNHFGIGINKIDNTLKWMKDNYLLEYSRERKENGTLGKGFIIIKDGVDFIEKVVKKQKDNTRPMKNLAQAKPGPGKTDTYKINIDIQNKNKKTKCAEKQALGDNFNQETEKTKIYLPFWLPLNYWEEFKLHRKQIKKPMSELAEKKAIAVLDNLRKDGHDPLQVISNSIVNGWSGLFPVKNKEFAKNLNEMKSTVKEWGPGHPDYDRINFKN